MMEVYIAAVVVSGLVAIVGMICRTTRDQERDKQAHELALEDAKSTRRLLLTDGSAYRALDDIMEDMPSSLTLFERQQVKKVLKDELGG